MCILTISSPTDKGSNEARAYHYIHKIILKYIDYLANIFLKTTMTLQVTARKHSKGFPK